MEKKNFFELLKRYKYNSVLVKTFLLVIALEIAMIGVLNGIYFYRIEKNIYREIEESCIQEVERQGTLLDTMIEQIISFSFFTTTNHELVLLTLDSVDVESKEEMIGKVSAGIKSFQKSFDYIESAYIYLENQKGIITDNGMTEFSEIEDLEWMDYYDSLKQNKYYSLESRVLNDKYPYLLTVYYPVYRGEIYSGKIGMIVVNINMERLSDMLGFAFRDMRNVYMISENGELLYTNNTRILRNQDVLSEVLSEKMEFSETEGYSFALYEKNDIEMASATVRSSYGKWYYSMDFEMDYYGERFNDTRSFMLWSAVISLLIGVVSSIMLALRTYRPIRYAIGILENEETMVEEILDDEENQNELRYIFELTHRIPRGGTNDSVQAEEWMERLGRAQMHVLQSQITPHFLYNSLDAVNWMAIEQNGGKNEVSDAIQSLAQLLRRSMNQTSYFATLQEEMEQAKLYIQVLEIRDPGKLEVIWDIPESLYDRKVVRFTLQPLLENSIRHGFAHRRMEGRIEVVADCVGEQLILKVSDNGCGMTIEECYKINNRLASEYEIVKKHVGIQNVNQRIKIMFGEEYGLRLVPGNSEGLIVYMALPEIKV